MRRIRLVPKLRRTAGYSMAIMAVGLMVGIWISNRDIIRLSLLTGIVLWGVGATIEFAVGARKDAKDRHGFEFVFGLLIYAGLAYFVYYLVMLLLKGK